MTRHEQLVENYENALFELLMEGEIEREGEQIEKENEQLKNGPGFSVPPELDKRCMASIKKACRRRRSGQLGRKAYGVLSKVAVVVLVGHHIAHAALHRLAVEAAAAGLVEGDVLVQQHETLGVLFLGGHGESGGRRDVHEGVKAHQIPQDEVHIHGGGHVAAVEAAGVRPGAAGGADALREGIHLAHPACKVAARKAVGKAHRGLVGVAQKHGVDGFPVGEGLIGAHIGIITVVDVIRDGKGHLEGVVELVGVIRQQQRDGHIFGQAPGRHLTGAVLVVDDDVGVGVDDVTVDCHFTKISSHVFGL